jgi:hypothetical protein
MVNQKADSVTHREPKLIDIHIFISSTQGKRLIEWYYRLFDQRDNYHGPIDGID